MKKVARSAFVLCLFISSMILSSCESFSEEEEIVLLPVNMTATIVQGSSTRKIIADYYYVPGTDRLDHITWSNHQTHEFAYDDLERIRMVRKIMVDTRVQEEMWFHYEGTMVDQVLLVKRNLDYIFLEPLDSVCTGSISFGYEGNRVCRQTTYETEEGAGQQAVREVVYAYDAKGNIVSSLSSDPRTKSGESVSMTYDRSRHPLSGLKYYFTGESFVNNLLRKNMAEQGLEYTYELRVNESGYPEIITEKLGAANSRYIRYTYMTL